MLPLEVSLLPLQLLLRPPLFRLNLLPQALHVALLHLHVLPSGRLLRAGDAGTGLPLELHFFSALKTDTQIWDQMDSLEKKKTLTVKKKVEERIFYLGLKVSKSNLKLRRFKLKASVVDFFLKFCQQ